MPGEDGQSECIDLFLAKNCCIRVISEDNATDEKKYEIKVPEKVLRLLSPEELKSFQDSSLFFKATEEESARLKAKELAKKVYVKLIQADLLKAENVIVICGAGTSVDLKTTPQGKVMSELWNDIAIQEFWANIPGFNDFDEFLARVKVEDAVKQNKDIEALLSRAELVLQFESDIQVEKAVELIKKHIVDNCSLQFNDGSEPPHYFFLQKIMNRRSNLPRVKIFTLNYDTLFEQAAEKLGAIVVDGFSFSPQKSFQGYHFELDLIFRNDKFRNDDHHFHKNIFHLYKLHGSVDWEQEIVSKKIRKLPSKVEKPCLIYPRNGKYEDSYRQPFFEMMARLQMALRGQNTFLLIIGYSFRDNHINAAIEEAIEKNRSLQVLAVNKSIQSPDTSDSLRTKLFNWANKSERVTLLAQTFLELADDFPEGKTEGPEEREESIFRK